MPDINLLRCPSCGEFPPPRYREYEELKASASKEFLHNGLYKHIDERRCGQVCRCGAIHGIDWEAVYQLPPRPTSEIVCDLRTLLNEGQSRRREEETGSSAVPLSAGWYDACDLMAYEAYRAGAFANDRNFVFAVQRQIRWCQEEGGECYPYHFSILCWLEEFWIPVVVPGWVCGFSDARNELRDSLRLLAEFLRLLEGYALSGNPAERETAFQEPAPQAPLSEDWTEPMKPNEIATMFGKSFRTIKKYSEEKGNPRLLELSSRSYRVLVEHLPPHLKPKRS